MTARLLLALVLLVGSGVIGSPMVPKTAHDAARSRLQGSSAPLPAVGFARSLLLRADRERALLPSRIPAARQGSATGWREQRTLTVTAYTWTGARTACGPWPTVGMAASNLFPCGARLHVQGIGTVTVEDRSAPGATDVDVFLPSEAACMRFGRRRLRVEVIP